MNQFIISSNIARLVGLPAIFGFILFGLGSGLHISAQLQFFTVSLAVAHIAGTLILLKWSSPKSWDIVSNHYPQGLIKKLALIIHDYIFSFINSWACKALIFLLATTAIALIADGVKLQNPSRLDFFISWQFCTGYIFGFWLAIFGTTIFNRPSLGQFKSTKKLNELLDSKKRFEYQQLPKTLLVFVPSLTYYFTQSLRYISVLCLNICIFIHNHFRLRKLLILAYPLTLVLDSSQDLYSGTWWTLYLAINRTYFFTSFLLAWFIFSGAIYFSFNSIKENISSPSVGNIAISILVFLISFIFFMGFRFFALQICNPLKNRTP